MTEEEMQAEIKESYEHGLPDYLRDGLDNYKKAVAKYLIFLHFHSEIYIGILCSFLVHCKEFFISGSDCFFKSRANNRLMERPPNVGNIWVFFDRPRNRINTPPEGYTGG